MAKIVKIDCSRITDWENLHEVFADAFGFPEYYGRNSNAWIDCMTNLDTADQTTQVSPGEAVTVQLEAVQGLKKRHRSC